MSSTIENKELDSCGCCEPNVEEQPQHDNPPGQASIIYRMGTYSEFVRRMLARVSFQTVTGGATPLARLTTRATDDPAIAMLDAWATSLDVLTFYQERIANEGYLRTATERRSVLELAREIGYELSPGVAASTHLAFTVEDADDRITVVTVPEGTRVQNVPTKQELPQTFETVEDLEAYAKMNAMQARRTSKQKLELTSTGIYLKGITAQVQIGDALLIVGSERECTGSGTVCVDSKAWFHAIVTGVKASAKENHTWVTWGKKLQEIKADGVIPAEPRVFVMRQQAAIFGHNAPDWNSLPQSVKEVNGDGCEWPVLFPDNAEFKLDLAYPKVVAGSWLVMTGPVLVGGTSVLKTKLYRVDKASVGSYTGFSLSARVTAVTPDTNGVINANYPDYFHVRTARVFCQSEELELALLPLYDYVSGIEIELDKRVEELKAGRTLIVKGRRGKAQVAVAGLKLSGTVPVRTLAKGEIVSVRGKTVRTTSTSWLLRTNDGIEGTLDLSPTDVTSLLRVETDETDEIVSEVVRAARIVNDVDRSKIVLELALVNVYDRPEAEILGNVAFSTHGETVVEVLGSGDASQVNQRFALKKPPLTYVSSASATGNVSTLEIRVNRVLWKEVPFLFGQDSRAQIYMVRTDEDGTVRVVFGDGINGTRLQTGTENVIATYRSGVGLMGEVPAGSLTLLQTRPLGIRSVINPLPAIGAGEQEQMENARINAPHTILTFGRIVSLDDFENFAGTFAGIGKAKGVLLWNGSQQLVHLTIAAESGSEILSSSLLYRNLLEAISAVRDQTIDVEIGSFKRVLFNVDAKVLVDDRYVVYDVLLAVEQALLAEFSFEKRAFGQRVAASEVISLIQSIPGVIAVDLDRLYPTDAIVDDPSQAKLNQIIPANQARWGTQRQVEQAELLLVNPDGITISKM